MNTYPDEFPTAETSFPVPVPAPTVEPDDQSDIVSVCFNRAWLPVVLGALQQLTQQAAWQGTALEVSAANERAQLLIDMFGNAGGYTVCCDTIVNCILTDENTQDALRQYLIGSGLLAGSSGGNSTPLDGLLQQILAALGAGCTPASRYGLAYKLVDVLDAVTTDLLQIVVAITDEEELAYALATNVPIVGQFVGTALAIAHYFLTNAIDLYYAAYNQVTHEALACVVYCAMADGCDITLEQLASAYRTEIDAYGPPPLVSAFEDFVEWLKELTLGTQEAIVAGYHYLLLNVFIRGATWVRASVSSIAIGAQLPEPFDL